MPSYTFAEATPFFAVIFFIIVILWVFAVRGLGKEYDKKVAENEAIENNS
jgi:AAA family ATP:ADP antiporter